MSDKADVSFNLDEENVPGTSSDSPVASTPMMDTPTPHSPTKKDKPTVRIQEPPVTGRYEVIKIQTKHGQLYNAIPTLPLPLAVIYCIFNIFLPGVGTLFASFSVLCCGQTRLARCRSFGLNLLSSFLQMLTFLVIVGWVWSIRWGMLFVQLSISSREGKPIADNLPYYVRRQSSVDFEKQQKAHIVS